MLYGLCTVKKAVNHLVGVMAGRILQSLAQKVILEHYVEAEKFIPLNV